jgi:hypothetical protein
MPVPDFSPGEVLTAAAMDSIGLWKVASVDFSNTTTINVDNVFTSNYRNYKLVCSLRPNTTNTGAVEIQLRAGGANLAGNNYIFQGVNQNVSNAPTANNGGFITTGTYFTNFFQSSDLSAMVEMTVVNPQLAQWTGFISTTMFEWAGVSYYYRAQTAFYTNAAQADGFRLIPSAAITGNIKIYGMRD